MVCTAIRAHVRAEVDTSFIVSGRSPDSYNASYHQKNAWTVQAINRCKEWCGKDIHGHNLTGQPRLLKRVRCHELRHDSSSRHVMIRCITFKNAVNVLQC